MSSAKRLENISQQLKDSKPLETQSNIKLVHGSAVPKLILDRPKALNSLNLDMIRDMIKLLPIIEKYPAFWIEGTGGKAFCAGGDVKVLFEGDVKVQTRQQFFREEFQLDYRLAIINSVQIANWDGIVMGGGVGLTHFAPIRIATQNTIFAMPEAKIGFFVDVGAGYTLANLKNNIGMYLGLISSRLKGEEVYLSGLANYYVEKKNIPTIYQQICKAVINTKNIKESIHMIVSKYQKNVQQRKIDNQDQIQYIFGADSVNQIYSRAKQSTSAFGKEVVKLLESMCPLSIHAIFKLINESKNMSKRDIFKRDFVVSQNFIENHNFDRGVTSLLIKKDNKPKWNPSNLLSVPQHEVDSLFVQKQGKVPLQI